VQVLIVDPSEIVRRRLVALVAGVEQVAVIGQAERATQAIVAMCVLRPELVILDIQLPDGDGVAVLGAAKRLDHAPAVLVLTNCADAYHRLRCEAAGADFFLDKSKQFEDIPGILRGMIEQGVANHG
jgi:DNA-binding NarL/FixJ family response regulator